MAFSEYGDLSPGERAAVLSTLATLALGNETIRNHFYEQAEASIGPVRTGPKASHAALHQPAESSLCCCILLLYADEPGLGQWRLC